MLPFRTTVAGVVWPAIVSTPGAALLALLFQLEQSQWLSPVALVERQFQQLDVLVEFLWQTSRFYRERLSAAAWSPAQRLDAASWCALPILKRATVQSCRAQLTVENSPKAHGRPLEYSTTGSLGMPVQGLGNELTHLFASALIVRNHLWQRRDLSAKFAAIRSKVASGSHPDWGRVESAAFVTGPASVLDISTDIDRQLDWLCADAPHYLLTHPSNLRSLLLRARERAIRVPSLRELSTFGEMLPADLRALARDLWQLPLSDVYSSEEFGNIALQCPEHPESYHVQAENLLVEIVDDSGSPCAAGAIGRVLVSTLHNFTMPLLRYEIGDYAQAGALCACGRGLPVLQRIAGRRRNMLRLPDGRSHWPSFPYEDLKPIADFRQIQIVQHELQAIEVRLAGTAPLPRDTEEEFSAKLCQLLHGRFSIRYAYAESLTPAGSGKFEDFVSLLPDEA
jgi:phenylacetate-CoA ligase